MFRFEKLDVWHREVEFADSVYSTTRKFPSDERFGLTRGDFKTDSGWLGTTEGSPQTLESWGRRRLRPQPPKPIDNFEIAYDSLMEVVSQTQIAHRQNFLTIEDRNTLNQQAEELSRMLSGLRKKLVSGS